MLEAVKVYLMYKDYKRGMTIMLKTVMTTAVKGMTDCVEGDLA